MSPALAGGFLRFAPPGTSLLTILISEKKQGANLKWFATGAKKGELYEYGCVYLCVLAYICEKTHWKYKQKFFKCLFMRKKVRDQCGTGKEEEFL